MVTSSYVRLTPDRQSKQGNLWNTAVCGYYLSQYSAVRVIIFIFCDQPLRVHNWEVLIHFNVHGGGKDLFGDGFAFWYTKERGKFGKAVIIISSLSFV